MDRSRRASKPVYLDGMGEMGELERTAMLNMGWRRGVSPASLNSSSGEEELRIRERRETRVSMVKVKDGKKK